MTDKNQSDQFDSTVDWYKLLVEQGRAEVQISRARLADFYRLHMGIAAASLALYSYSVSSGQKEIFYLAILVIFMGLVNAWFWLKQSKSSSVWEARWYESAARIEKTPEFREKVGVPSVKVLSHEEVFDRISIKGRKNGSSSNVYRISSCSFLFFYVIILCGSLYTYFDPDSNIFSKAAGREIMDEASRHKQSQPPR